VWPYEARRGHLNFRAWPYVIQKPAYDPLVMGKCGIGGRCWKSWKKFPLLEKSGNSA